MGYDPPFGYFTVQTSMSFKLFQIQKGVSNPQKGPKEKFPHEGDEHLLDENMRSAGGRVEEPPSPHLQFRYPHCVPILAPMVLDSSHNLRMIHEGRTIVTILV